MLAPSLHMHPSQVLPALNCGCRLVVSLQWLLSIRVSEIPPTYSAASVSPFLLIRQNDGAGKKQERDVSDASCLLGVMEHTSELFPSAWSPEVSIKRQITGNSCTAPSTEITYACDKQFWWLWIHVVMDSVHLRNRSTLMLRVQLKPLLITRSKSLCNSQKNEKGEDWGVLEYQSPKEDKPPSFCVLYK